MVPQAAAIFSTFVPTLKSPLLEDLEAEPPVVYQEDIALMLKEGCVAKVCTPNIFIVHRFCHQNIIQ